MKATAACSSVFNSACPRDSLMELSCAQVRLIPSAECTQDPANCPEHGNVPESLQSEVPQRKTLLYRCKRANCPRKRLPASLPMPTEPLCAYGAGQVEAFSQDYVELIRVHK